MDKNMIPKVAVAVFFVAIFGLLIGRRLAVPPQEIVMVLASQQSDFAVGEKLRRGETLETDADEYVTIKIGDDLAVGIDERSRLELHRLFTDERTLRFTRGRIAVNSSSHTPVLVETNKTLNIVENGKAIFINYDFQQLVTVAPVIGSVQTQIKGQRDYLLIPVPLNIKETDPVSLSKTTVEPTQGSSAAFHAWFDSVVTE